MPANGRTRSASRSSRAWWWVGSRYGERSRRWRSLMRGCCGHGIAADGGYDRDSFLAPPEPAAVARAPATASLARKAEAALRTGRATEALELAKLHAREK